MNATDMIVPIWVLQPNTELISRGSKAEYQTYKQIREFLRLKLNNQNVNVNQSLIATKINYILTNL